MYVSFCEFHCTCTHMTRHYYKVNVVYKHQPNQSVPRGTWGNLGYACVSLKTGGRYYFRKQRKLLHAIRMDVELREEDTERVVEATSLDARAMGHLARDWVRVHEAD